MSNSIREQWYQRFVVALKEGTGDTLLVTTSGSVIAVDPSTPASEQAELEPAWIFTAQAARGIQRGLRLGVGRTRGVKRHSCMDDSTLGGDSHSCAGPVAHS